MWVLIVLAIVYAGAYMHKVGSVNLKWFSAYEFGPSLPFLKTDLLLKLDDFRGRLGRPVIVSPAFGSLFRKTSPNDSEHLRGAAADVMLPQGPSLREAFAFAKAVGFTGIGVYPFWSPYPGLHLDVRSSRTPGDPAVWSGLKDDSGKQYYAALDRGFIA